MGELYFGWWRVTLQLVGQPALTPIDYEIRCFTGGSVRGSSVSVHDGGSNSSHSPWPRRRSRAPREPPRTWLLRSTLPSPWDGMGGVIDPCSVAYRAHSSMLTRIEPSQSVSTQAAQVAEHSLI